LRFMARGGLGRGIWRFLERFLVGKEESKIFCEDLV
jgi:hypothetical protein